MNIYILNLCDEWKTLDKMHKICVTTSFQTIIDLLRELMKEEEIFYNSDSGSDSCQLFNQHLSELNKSGLSDREIAYEMTNNLKFAHIEVWKDGEINL